MKSRSTAIAIFMLLCTFIAMAAPRRAEALTPACTQINNTAILDYRVSGVNQTALSGSASFIVGNKVDLLVTTVDSNFVIVPPNSVASAMTFSVTNKGNATQKYNLATIAEPSGTALFGGTDNFDANNVKIFAGGIQTSTIAALASGESRSATIVVDIPNSANDGDVTVYALKAVTRNIDNSPLIEGTGQAIAGGVSACMGDVVFGDAAGTDDNARDAAHSSRDAIKIIAAYISVTKTAAAVYDPVNCSSLVPIVCSGSPKEIPGAVIEYTIQVSNSATGTAANMTVTDTLDANLAFYPDGYAAGKGLQMTAPNLYSGNPTALTNASGDDEGTYNTGTRTVTVNNIMVQKNESAFVKFRATIN